MRVLSTTLRRFAGTAATAGLAVLALPAPGAQAAAPPGLDHLKCYGVKVAASSGHVAVVKLVDQFGSSTAKVAQQPERLCNPVQKTLPDGTVTPVRNPRAHELCYRISDDLTGTREVLVENQFGRARLTIGPAQRLCLPTWKAFRPGFPSAPAPSSIDHFKCYAAKYSAVQPLTFTLPTSVGLKDQFESVVAKLGAPVELCNPVTKVLPNGTSFAPSNPKAHEVCFTMKQDPAHTSRHVFTKNQFGKASLDTTVPSVLCLPSFKKVV